MTLANRITFFRLALIPVFCGMIFLCTAEHDGLRYAALAVYLAASISDFADGYIARNWNQASKLGTRLDPMADKLLVNLGFVFLAANESLEHNIPLWFPPLLLLRDVIIIMSAFLIFRWKGKVSVQPSMSGKLTVVFQFGTMVFVLMQWPYVAEMMWTTLALTVISGFGYIGAGWRQANAPKAA